MTDTPATAPVKPLKVALVGTAPTSRGLAPFNNPEWEIWACSAGNVGILPRVNIWFEMHAIAEMVAPENQAMAFPFYQWLKAQSEAGTFQVVMPEFNQFVPKAIPYPLKEMIGLFGRNWFTSTIAYMMAIAISRGATEIGLFGIDMAAGQEHYEAQRAGCTRFIEIAEERGIKVHVPMESSLKVATPLYGYWEGSPFGRRLNAVRQQVLANVASLNAQIDNARIQKAFFEGADEQLRYFTRTWVDGEEMELNLGNIEELVAKAKEAGAAPERVDAMLDTAAASLGRENITVVETTAGLTVAPVAPVHPISPLNSLSAFQPLIAPSRLNGAAAEPEPHTETMQS